MKDNLKIWGAVLVFVLLNILLGKYQLINFWLPAILVFIGMVITDLVSEGRPSGKQNKLNFRLLWFSILIAFVIGECLLRSSGAYKTWPEQNLGEYRSQYALSRAADADWYHRWTPNSDIDDPRPEFNYFKKSNSLGFLSEEFKPDTIENKFRIIGVGDSFTEGVGAPMDSTWVKLMENKLNLDSTSGFYTMNVGISGSDLYYGYVALRDLMLTKNPDLVILAINTSDILDVLIRGGMERFKSDSTVAYKKPPWFEVIYKDSHIARGFMKRILKYNEFMFTKNQMKEKEVVALKEIASGVRLYDKTAKENGFQFCVVLHPVAAELIYEGYPIKGLKSHFADSTIPIFDIFEDMRYREEDDPPIESIFWPKDLHYNSKGYQKMGNIIADRLLENGLIPN
ncbi:MAG: hypothetical protein AAF502_15810 [Bacteroidota bacterium]